jgi:hypothetical protein
MSDQQPVLPATVWYESEVQVRAVIAAAAQVVSILLRIVGRYTELSITTDMIDMLVADVTQLLAIWFGVLAIIKRQTSAVAPLTLTTTGAAMKSMTNPSLLDADPTKVPKEKP